MPKQYQKRDLETTLKCSFCNKEYHPWKSATREYKQSRYCSGTCRIRAMNLARKNGGVDITPMPLRIAVTSPTSDEYTLHSNADETGEMWRESGEYWDKLANWYIERQSRELKRRMLKNAAYSSVSTEGKTITLTGFGSKMFVKRGNLILIPGNVYSTQNTDEIILYKGIHGVSTITWITNGHSGSVTVDAMHWCASQNITVRILSNRGTLLTTIFPYQDAPVALGYPNHFNKGVDIKLRRMQYMLELSGLDIVVAKEIILRKLHAQLECLDAHSELPDRERGYYSINNAITMLSSDKQTKATTTLEGIRLVEARASQGYFSAFQGIPLLIDDKAVKIWPPQWRTVTERNSQLTRWMSARNAVNPFHALMNFVNSVLEAQVRSALHSIGCDICVGILHADKDNRDNLVFDVIEPLRGLIESLLLDFVKTHVFSAGDFSSLPTGQVTINPQMCKVLAEQIRLPQRRVDEEAYWLKERLFELMRDS